MSDQPRIAAHWLRIPRQTPGIPVPQFVRHPRRPAAEPLERHFYAAAYDADGAATVFRFKHRANRDDWLDQGGQERRVRLFSEDPLVVAAKAAGEWPDDEGEE